MWLQEQCSDRLNRHRSLVDLVKEGTVRMRIGLAHRYVEMPQKCELSCIVGPHEFITIDMARSNEGVGAT